MMQSRAERIPSKCMKKLFQFQPKCSLTITAISVIFSTVLYTASSSSKLVNVVEVLKTKDIHLYSSQASNSTILFKLTNTNLGKDDVIIKRRIFMKDDVAILSYDMRTSPQNLRRQKRGFEVSQFTGNFISIRPGYAINAELIIDAVLENIPLRITTETTILGSNKVSGYLSTPSFYSNLPKDQYISWLITYPKHNRIILEILDTTFEECCAELYIYDWLKPSDPLLAMFNGVLQPNRSNIVYGNAPSMLLEYHSRCFINRQGFSATYINSIEMVGWKATNFTEMSCGSIITADNYTTGWVSSPNFPESYSNEMKCEWKLYTKVGSYIQLLIHQLNLPKSEDDRLEIRHASLDKATNLNEVTCTGGNLTINSNELTLTFFSDNVTSCGYGFNISFLAFRISNELRTTANPTDYTSTVKENNTTIAKTATKHPTTATRTGQASTAVKMESFDTSTQPFERVDTTSESLPDADLITTAAVSVKSEAMDIQSSTKREVRSTPDEKKDSSTASFDKFVATEAVSETIMTLPTETSIGIVDTTSSVCASNRKAHFNKLVISTLYILLLTVS